MHFLWAETLITCSHTYSPLEYNNSDVIRSSDEFFFNLSYIPDRSVTVCHSSDMATYQATEDELVLLHSVDEFERYIRKFRILVTAMAPMATVIMDVMISMALIAMAVMVEVTVMVEVMVMMVEVMVMMVEVMVMVEVIVMVDGTVMVEVTMMVEVMVMVEVTVMMEVTMMVEVTVMAQVVCQLQ